MGCAFLLGGLKFPTQKFSQPGAATQCSLMALSVFTFGLPTLYGKILKEQAEFEHMLEVSRWASLFLLLTYAAYLYFQLGTHSALFEEPGEEEDEEPDLSPCVAAVVLAIATVLTSYSTDFLIDSIEGTVEKFDLSQEFIGIILLPIIGNAAEHYTAITVAMRNKMDLALGVAAGSSCQMALLVTPFSVLVGWAYDRDMSLDFHSFQLAVLFIAVFLTEGILNDGSSNWLEGLLLLVTRRSLGVLEIEDPAGEDVTAPPLQSFSDLELRPVWLKEALGKELKTLRPTQAQMLPILLAGLNAIVISSAAVGEEALMYLLLAALQACDQHPLTEEEPGPVCLILAAESESCSSITQSAQKLFQHSSSGKVPVRVANLSGGGSRSDKLREMSEKGAHVVVATPKRIHDMADKYQISLLRVTLLIVDGLDGMEAQRVDSGVVTLAEVWTFSTHGGGTKSFCQCQWQEAFCLWRGTRRHEDGSATGVWRVWPRNGY
eukprot:symbB.v1.2.003890.t1/scaffold211.1/size373615/31